MATPRRLPGTPSNPMGVPQGSQALSPPATPNQPGDGEAKRKRPPNELPSDGEPATKLVRPDAPDQSITLEDAMTCSICMGEWTNSGVHRVVSLECGHLFGRSCIERWLTPVEKGIVKKCPTCGNKGKLRDLRNIYPIAVVAVDSDQVERLKHEVSVERGKREQKERELEQARLSLNMIRAERDRYESELRGLRMRQQQGPSRPAPPPPPPLVGAASSTCSQPQPSSSQSTAMAHLPGSSQDQTPSQRRVRANYTWTSLPAHQIPMHGTYRHLAAFPDGDQLALSLQTGPDSHTVLLYSLAATAVQLPTNPLHMHSKPIKHLAVSPRGLNSPYSAHLHLLTAGLDARACLLRETRVVTEFRVPCPAWSCAFDSLDGFRVWVGGADCCVYGFDLRMPGRPWTRLGVTEVLGARGPGVHSLAHVPEAAGAEGAGGGVLVAATMKGAVAWTGLGGGPAATLYPTAGQYAPAFPPPTQQHAPTDATTTVVGSRIPFPPTLDGRQCFAMEPVHAPTGIPSALTYAFRYGSNPMCATSSTQTSPCTWTWPAHVAQSNSPATLMTRFAAWQWAVDEPAFMVLPNEALNKLDVYCGHRWVADLVPMGSRGPLLDLKVLGAGGGEGGGGWVGANEGRVVVAGVNEVGTVFMYRQEKREEEEVVVA